MKRIVFLLVAVAAVAAVVAFSARVSGHTDEAASPIYGVTIPPGYRDWKMIAVAQLRTDKVDQMRAQLGNEIAIKAYKEGKVPFPDGAIIRVALDSCLVGRQQQSPGRSVPGRSIFRCRIPGEYAGHGQRLKKVRRDGRLGVWRLQSLTATPVIRSTARQLSYQEIEIPTFTKGEFQCQTLQIAEKELNGQAV